MKHMPRKETNEETGERQTELSRTQNLVETIQQMQSQIDKLKLQLRKTQQIPSVKIGTIFLVPGVLALIFSILHSSPVLAFIGLTLTFWGFLFFFITPIRYVKSSLLDSAAASAYSTINRIIKDLDYKGRGYYIPPYPKDVYLPGHLKGLKEMIAFISAQTSPEMPSMQEIAQSKFLLKNPQGICVTPPGLGLLNQFEDEFRTDMAKLELTELCQTLPTLILEDFPLAKEIQIHPQQGQVYLKITDSIYKNLYSQKEKLESIHLLGSPLVSAIACSIAKSTGKIVTIHKQEISPDGQTIQVWYHFLEG